MLLPRRNSYLNNRKINKADSPQAQSKITLTVTLRNELTPLYPDTICKRDENVRPGFLVQPGI